MMVVRMATGQEPGRMSYRRFAMTLSRCREVRAWIEGKGELPDLCPAVPADLAAIGL